MEECDRCGEILDDGERCPNCDDPVEFMTDEYSFYREDPNEHEFYIE